MFGFRARADIVRQYSGLDISTVPGVDKINTVLRSLNNMLKLNQVCVGPNFCRHGNALEHSHALVTLVNYGDANTDTAPVYVLALVKRLGVQ